MPRLLALFLFLALPHSALSQTPFDTPDGRLCFERWVATTVERLNDYDGDAVFNDKKPWRLDSHGAILGQGEEVAAPQAGWTGDPDTLARYMWKSLSSGEPYPYWPDENFRAAKAPGLRHFVLTCLQGSNTAGSGGTGSGAGRPDSIVEATQSIGPAISVPDTAFCPKDLTLLNNLSGIVMGCICPSQTSLGTIWGSHPYTSDSDVCGAAIHAGVIERGGGLIWVSNVPGLAAYSGSTRHDVSTQDYGPWDHSIVFLNAPATHAAGVQASVCPATMQRVPDSVTCNCGPQSFASGRVWGSGPYTNDSALCRAALHAGAVTAEGGQITARAVPDAGAYTGSTAFGVATKNYGPWQGAFVFDN